MFSITRAAPLAVLAALALPATATATTYTVGPGQKVADAAAKAKPGDVIDIAPGVYKESVEVKEANVSLTGHPGTQLVGDPAAKDGTPTLKFSAASGTPDAVSSMLVANLVTAAPAISAGSAGLTVGDAIVVGAKGPAVGLGGGTNVVQRSFLYGTDGLLFASSASAAHTLVADSTIFVGSTGAGLHAVSAGTQGSAITGAPGAMGIDVRHATVVGATNAFLFNADAPDPVTSAGDITATATDSIALGTNKVSRAASRQTGTPIDQVVGGVQGALGGGTGGGSVPPTGTPLDTAAAQIAGQGQSNGAGKGGKTSLTTTRTATSGSPAALFADAAKLNYHLRADSPAIGIGGFTSGESATDIDGQARSVAGVSDLGADQFVNRAPTAALGAASASLREGGAVTLDASRSSDPEAAIGGGIAGYHWDFGDGQTVVTATPAASHAYDKRGSYTVTLTVVDRQGAASPPATEALTVTDGHPPTIVVGSPTAGQRIRLHTKKGKALRVVLFGTTADESGIAAVNLAVRSTRRSGARCLWLDAKRGLRARSCIAPILLKPTLAAGGQWRLRLPARLRLKPGVYELFAAATDRSGLASAPKIVKFRVLK
jgi:hypothetical protein